MIVGSIGSIFGRAASQIACIAERGGQVAAHREWTATQYGCLAMHGVSPAKR